MLAKHPRDNSYWVWLRATLNGPPGFSIDPADIRLAAADRLWNPAAMAKKRQPIDDLIDAHVWLRRKEVRIGNLGVRGYPNQSVYAMVGASLADDEAVIVQC